MNNNIENFCKNRSVRAQLRFFAYNLGEIVLKSMPQGIVQFYLTDKGYGYVRDPETREEFHFTHRHVEGEVQRGTSVSFQIAEDRHGLHAIHVRPIKKDGKD
jgi:cold shock CspA family protein